MALNSLFTDVYGPAGIALYCRLKPAGRNSEIIYRVIHRKTAGLAADSDIIEPKSPHICRFIDIA